MSLLDDYLGAFEAPRKFVYKSIICECVNLNANIHENLLFRIYLTNPRLVDNVQTFIYNIEHDEQFKFLISTYYRISIQDMETRIEIDESDEKIRVFVLVKCVDAASVYSTFSKDYGVFSEDVGRCQSTISSGSVPFTIRGVTDQLDPDCEPVDVHGFISYRLKEPYGLTQNAIAMGFYGLSVEVTITNREEIYEVVPSYNILYHDEIMAGKIYEVLKDAEDTIAARVSPGNFMEMRFKQYIMYEPSSDRNHLFYRILLVCSGVNEWDLHSISPNSMVISLHDKECMKEMVKRIYQYDWNMIYCVWAELATALMSDAGTLYIPAVLTHSVDMLDNGYCFKVCLVPHLAPFTDEYTNYSSEKVLEEAAAEFYWLRANVFRDMTIIFPTLRYMQDREVLAYIRIPRWMYMGMNEENSSVVFDQFIADVCCDRLSMRVCAESQSYIYCALVDNVYYSDGHTNDLPTFVHSSVLGYFTPDKGSKLEDALGSLIGYFLSCYNFTGCYESLTTDQKKTATAMYRSTIGVVFGLWEASVHMQTREWYPTYKAVKQRYLSNLNRSAAQAKAEPEHDAVQKPSIISKFKKLFGGTES